MSNCACSNELDIDQPGNASASYWVLWHNRGAASVAMRSDVSAVPLASGDGRFIATGPGELAQGEAFTLRLGWNDPTLLPGNRRVGYLRVRPQPDHPGGWVPVRLERRAGTTTPDAPPAAVALANRVPHALQLAAATSHDRVFIDVPAGATSLTVVTESQQEVDLYLAHAATPSSPMIAAAPARHLAEASSQRNGGNEVAVVAGAALKPGRWYVVPVNTSSPVATLSLTATVVATAPIVRSGSYYNPARGGHGVFLYPAADQWVGLWYTYFQDGSPTWFYMQGAAPGPDGIWRGGIYRSTWAGTQNHMTKVGEAKATSSGPDAFQFTYTLDGETGSEPLRALGRGCPAIGGRPLDASSNWFNPASAGSGYSVQLWPDYEMYIAFVYDAQGVPRFLSAESGGSGGATRILALDQLTGFCPLCERTGNPVRRDIGTFQRDFSASSPRFSIDAVFAAGIPGVWTGDESVQPLGGNGTTQGCAP